MNMRRSKVLEKLRAGRVAHAFKLNGSCARTADLASLFRFDCIWSDREHIANDWSLLEKQIWAAKSNDTDVIVRVSKGSYSDYIRPLELDAAGIMVPHVTSAEEVRQVVRMTRFHPVGRRPLDGANADSRFLLVGMDEYLRQANEERFVVVQIEDPEAMDQLDEIAAVPGINVLFFGAGDYSHALGVPIQHPEVKKAREKVVRAAAAHGKFAGAVGIGEHYEELVAMGYLFINVGSDIRILREGLHALSSKLGL